MRSLYLRSEEALNTLLLTSSIILLVVSVRLGDYRVVSFAGLIMYAYLIISGRFIRAAVVMLALTPFQVLAAGQYSLYVFVYYPLLPVLTTVLRMNRSALVLIPVLLPSLACAFTTYQKIEVPLLHYTLLYTTALLTGYSLRVLEELITYGHTALKLASIDVLTFFSVDRLVKLVAGLYIFTAVFTLTLVTSPAYGLTIIQSVFLSFAIGLAVLTAWTLLRSTRAKLTLLLLVTSVFLILGGLRLTTLLEEVVRLVEEAMKILG